MTNIMGPMMGVIMAVMMFSVIGQVVAGTQPAPPPTPFQCPYCEESFATLDELIAHVALVHPDMPQITQVDITWD